MSENDNSLSNLVTGLVLGAIAGAGFYYFLTQTEEGEKVKKVLREKGEDVLNDLTGIVEDIEDKGEEFKEKAQTVQDELSQKAESLKEGVVGEVKEGLSQIEELRERGRKAAKFFLHNGKSLV